jgi:hypothetical protein
MKPEPQTARAAENDNAAPETMSLELLIEDPRAVALLWAVPEGRARLTHAGRAGLLALEQARGQIDAESVRREGDRILQVLDEKLSGSARDLHNRIASTITEYFDPASGRLPERLRLLVARDGELEQLLRRVVGGADSEMARTLAAHVGEGSPLMQVIDPERSGGLASAIEALIGKQLGEQRAAILREFSLDEKDGALRRLIDELEERHGKLEAALGDKIDCLVKELSADEEDSALSRLIRRVELAQKTITAEFSLDNQDSALARLKRELDETRATIDRQLTLDDDGSPLSRLRRELLEVLAKQKQVAETFQTNITQMVGELVGRREAEARSTLHGHRFEDVVVAEISRRVAQEGHIAEAVGNTTGRKRYNKKGDLVVELGPDHAAAAARVVWEAKEDASYNLKKARAELEEARSNRDAGVGVFVFSSKSAPADMPAFRRIGDDLFVVWDAEDPATDVLLDAALAVSTALSIRRVESGEEIEASLEAIERAVIEVEKRVENLDQIHTWATTIRNNGDRILDRVAKDRKALHREIEALRTHSQSLRGAIVP